MVIMVDRLDRTYKVARNLITGAIIAIGSGACASSSLTVKNEAAPITYKIDGQGGQYASLNRNISLNDPISAPIQRPSGLSQSQIVRPQISQPQITQPSRPVAQAPQSYFDPSRVDKQLYAHQSVRKPYVINGKTYTPKHEPNYDKTGLASWYGPKFNGKPTASGEIFDKNDLTAAHKTLPLNSMVHVTNLENGKTLMVRINDRGPFVDDRIIDLSEASAMTLGTIQNGLAKVRVRYAGPADTNAVKHTYTPPAPRPVTPTPAPTLQAQPQYAPTPSPQLSAPRPVAPTPQAQSEYVPLRQLGQPVTVPPVASAPQVQPQVQPQPQQASGLPAPQYEAAPIYQAPPAPAPVPYAQDRLAPVTPPRPEAGGNVTLTIKGPIHMATQDEDAPQPKWIPTVNRVTKTK